MLTLRTENGPALERKPWCPGTIHLNTPMSSQDVGLVESIKIADLPIGKTAKETLQSVGLTTVEQCATKTAEELSRFLGIGKKALQVIKEVCAQQALPLKDSSRSNALNGANWLIEIINSAKTIPELLDTVLSVVESLSKEGHHRYSYDSCWGYGWMQAKVNDAFEKKFESLLREPGHPQPWRLLRRFVYTQRRRFCENTVRTRQAQVGGRPKFQRKIALHTMRFGTFADARDVLSYFCFAKGLEMLSRKAQTADELWEMACLTRHRQPILWRQVVRKLSRKLR